MRLTNMLKLAIVLALLVIMMGAYTRLADAGLGCPDWPGCYGNLTVPLQANTIAKAEMAYPERPVDEYKAWLEMIHRYLAGMLALLIFAIFIGCLRSARLPKKLPTAIALLVVFQAALGMWTVTLKLMPIIVMGHLLGGFALISLLYLLYLRTKPTHTFEHHRELSPIFSLAIFGMAILLIQIMLGGWTSANYAALSCTVLPFCEGDWQAKFTFANAFSPFQGNHASFEFGVLDYASRMTIHVTHRIGAIVTAAVLLYLTLRILISSLAKPIKQGAIVLLILLLLQISLGMANIIFHLPLAIAVLHNITAALLLLTLIFISYSIWHRE